MRFTLPHTDGNFMAPQRHFAAGRKLQSSARDMPSYDSFVPNISRISVDHRYELRQGLPRTRTTETKLDETFDYAVEDLGGSTRSGPN